MRFSPFLNVGEDSTVETTYRLQIRAELCQYFSLQPCSFLCFSALSFSPISASTLHSSYTETQRQIHQNVWRFCDVKTKSHIGHILLGNENHRL